MPGSVTRPTTETRRVDELVHLVVSGRIRVPIYQDALRWRENDVLSLFDSIYRGFPIGSLLLHQRPAPAATLRLGPLTVHAPETSSAFDVIDGQQRLIALAASLARPEPIPTTPDDPYVVYFDPVDERFVRPPASGRLPETWAPLPVLADTRKVLEWVFRWPHAQDERLRSTLFEAGRRIRDYMVPLYSIETDDDEVAREIFVRVNTSGRPLEWPVIFDALYGAHRRGSAPSTLSELVDDLAEIGLGRIDERDALRLLLAHEGLDPSGGYGELEREHPGVLQGSVERVLPTLRRVLDFLRDEAEVVHLRLLPQSAPLSLLVRFFRLHPEPSSRSLELLTWWLWRYFLAIEPGRSRWIIRRGLNALDEDEEASVQRLIAPLPTIDPGTHELPDRLNLRDAPSRIATLGLASLQPRALASGRPIDVGALVEAADVAALRPILPPTPGSTRAPENLILLSGAGPARDALIESISSSSHDETLRSHAISPEAVKDLLEGASDLFLQRRRALLTEATRAMLARLTGFGRSTRPSIDYLLRSTSP